MDIKKIILQICLFPIFSLSLSSLHIYIHPLKFKLLKCMARMTAIFSLLPCFLPLPLGGVPLEVIDSHWPMGHDETLTLFEIFCVNFLFLLSFPSQII